MEKLKLCQNKSNFFKFSKLIIFLICLVIICIESVKCVERYDNLKDALKDYPHQDRKNGKPPKYVYFTFKEKRVREMDYFSKILYKFLSTTGVRPYFVNLKDSQLLGIVPKDAQIDKEAILSTFKDVIESIEIKETMH
jgi:hypothetical protein